VAGLSGRPAPEPGGIPTPSVAICRASPESSDPYGMPIPKGPGSTVCPRSPRSDATTAVRSGWKVVGAPRCMALRGGLRIRVGGSLVAGAALLGHGMLAGAQNSPPSPPAVPEQYVLLAISKHRESLLGGDAAVQGAPAARSDLRLPVDRGPRRRLLKTQRYPQGLRAGTCGARCATRPRVHGTTRFAHRTSTIATKPG
jgi:hypothetical protein